MDDTVHNSIKERQSRVFVLATDINHSTGDYHAQTLYVEEDVAFSIARSSYYAVVMIGKDRYKFFNGKPILDLL